MRIQDFLNFEFSKRLPRDFGGERIYVTGRADSRVLKPGWSGAAFDLQLVARKYFKPGMVVWDIGANQGILSFLAASKVGKSGAVYALEADPHYADLIFHSSQRLSDAYCRVSILCAAMADKASLLDFGVSAQGHSRNKLLDFENGAFDLAWTKTVVSVRGDDLLDHWRAPDFIKIDIEGAELAALGARDRILTGPRPVFYVEVCDENKKTVAELFRSYDYEIFHLRGDGAEDPIEDCVFYTIARPAQRRMV
jgi:FkbM family methyltransferase